MVCSNCSHQNEGGKFCENCGSPLATGGAAQETAAAVESTNLGNQGQAPNQYLTKTKNISKGYLSYALTVLKKPYASSVGVGKEHFVNSIITMVLYSFIIPLMLFFGVKALSSGLNDLAGAFGMGEVFQPSFMDIVIIPTFLYAIFILLVAIFTYAGIKLGRINPSFKEVIARFGSFLIPFTAVLIVALLLSLIKVKLFIYFLLLGFFGSIFTVPSLVIASYKKQSQEGIDVIYGTLVTYVLTSVLLYIMGQKMFDAIIKQLTQMLSGSFLGL